MGVGVMGYAVRVRSRISFDLPRIGNWPGLPLRSLRVNACDAACLAPFTFRKHTSASDLMFHRTRESTRQIGLGEATRNARAPMVWQLEAGIIVGKHCNNTYFAVLASLALRLKMMMLHVRDCGL